MSTAGANRTFQFGAGWLLFLDMTALVLFN